MMLRGWQGGKVPSGATDSGRGWPLGARGWGGIIANRLGPTGPPEEKQFHGAHWDQRVAVEVSRFDLRDNH